MNKSDLIAAVAEAAGISKSDAASAVLLRHGADLQARDQFNSTALGLARSAGRAAVADLLRRHGAVD